MNKKLRKTTVLKKVEREEELKINASVIKFREVVDLIKSTSKNLMYVVVVYYTYKMVEVVAQNFSGKSTIANIVFKMEFIWSFTTVAATIWGYVERRLRKKQIAACADEIKELKLRLDKNVGTSLLTKNGNNRKEDVL